MLDLQVPPIRGTTMPEMPAPPWDDGGGDDDPEAVPEEDTEARAA